MLSTKIFVSWLAVAQPCEFIEAFSYQKSTYLSHAIEKSRLHAAKKGFGSTIESVDKERKKSLEGLQDWASTVGIL